MISYRYDEKCGEATFEQVFADEAKMYDVNLYVGDCFLIFVQTVTNLESGKSEDILHSFFVDDGHMERCLKKNIFQHWDVLKRIRIDRAKCCNWIRVVELISQYMPDVTVEVYNSGEQTWGKYSVGAPIILDERMREIAELAISYMKDEDILDDFLEYELELTDEEKEYFGIYDDEDEE